MWMSIRFQPLIIIGALCKSKLQRIPISRFPWKKIYFQTIEKLCSVCNNLHAHPSGVVDWSQMINGLPPKCNVAWLGDIFQSHTHNGLVVIITNFLHVFFVWWWCCLYRRLDITNVTWTESNANGSGSMSWIDEYPGMCDCHIIVDGWMDGWMNKSRLIASRQLSANKHTP